MLPFRVTQIEQHRALQQKSAPLFIPKICPSESPLVTRSSPGRNHPKLNRQIPELNHAITLRKQTAETCSNRQKIQKCWRAFSPPVSLSLAQDFAGFKPLKTVGPNKKNDRVLARWAPTSNRQWSANRWYRKQTTKPRLTGARTHIRLSPNFTKIAHDFATFESQNTELPLWDPLWKTRRFLQSDRPLLPGSAQYIECDVTYSKQTTASFLPGATTAYRDRQNLDQSRQRW